MKCTVYSYGHRKNSGQTIHPATSIDTDRNKYNFQIIARNGLNSSVERSLCK